MVIPSGEFAADGSLEKVLVHRGFGKRRNRAKRNDGDAVLAGLALAWFNDGVGDCDRPLAMSGKFFAQHLLQMNVIFGITESIFPFAVAADIADGFTPFFGSGGLGGH